MDDFYVYAHIDRENEVPFYIGMGRGQRAYSKDRHYYWNLFVEKYAQSYEVRFIANNISEYDAMEIENYFIHMLGKVYNGRGLLVNWTDGGYNEGSFIKIGFGDDLNNFHSKLTEFGRNLISIKMEFFNSSTAKKFFSDIIENTIMEIRNDLIPDVQKVIHPRKSWIVPFCLIETPSKKGAFSLMVTEKEKLIEILNRPIELTELPSRPFVDSFIFRIMFYFDMLLQDNVKLMRGDKIISRPESDWYFYKNYWNGYIKIFQCIYSCRELDIKLVKKNKINHQREDIYDFEVFLS
jgi:hypothetical protein